MKTLLTVNYIRPDKKKGVEESFEVIYKTEDGNVHKVNEPAEVDIWIVKPEYRDFHYNKPQELTGRMEKRRVLVSNVIWEIAKEIGDEAIEFLKQCREEFRKPRELRNKRLSMNRLLGWRFAYACDFQPEFYFMRDWYQKHELQNPTLTKAFLDIEIDQIDYTADLDKLSGTAHAPVNCLTIFLDEHQECYTFILRPQPPSRLSYTNDQEYQYRLSLYQSQLAQHEELMSDTKSFTKDLNKQFHSMYGTIDYHIRDYESEIELISDLFRLINDRKPNFCLSWNMRFDIQYLLERIKVLGYDPRSIMCHKDFDNPRCYFNVDRRMFDVREQTDYFSCSSYTHYVCQMRLYSTIRKSQQKLKSVKLNAIAERELRDKKIDYPEETNVVMFPYVDWKKFILYNVKDVLLIVNIEKRVQDIRTYYLRSHSNLTPYNKVFKETHLVRNVREMYFNRDEWVQGNNLNVIDNEDDEFSRVENNDDPEESSFKGAILADPLLNDKVGMEILGVPSSVLFPNATDWDMSSFYPNLKSSNNQDPSTLIAKASFNNQEFLTGKCTNRSLNTDYEEKDKFGKIRSTDITGEAVHTYVSGNILTFGYHYLNFPSIEEIANDVQRLLQ